MQSEQKKKRNILYDLQEGVYELGKGGFGSVEEKIDMDVLEIKAVKTLKVPLVNIANDAR